MLILYIVWLRRGHSIRAIAARPYWLQLLQLLLLLLLSQLNCCTANASGLLTSRRTLLPKSDYHSAVPCGIQHRSSPLVRMFCGQAVRSTPGRCHALRFAPLYAHSPGSCPARTFWLAMTRAQHATLYSTQCADAPARTWQDIQPSDTLTQQLPGDPLLSNAEQAFPAVGAPPRSSLIEKLMRTSRQVPGASWSFVAPESQPEPHLITVSAAMQDVLGLTVRKGETSWQETEQYMSGNRLLDGTHPWAHRYAGHQFGSFAGQLGDGRAVSLGEFLHNEQRWELQLKGSGRTPYSRFGDGYAVLRSSIREFLASEAMHTLRVPTSRALSLIRTTRTVLRETGESGAVVCRAAPSWIRFGSFEAHYYGQEWRALRRLADYVIRQHFPHLLAVNTAQTEEGNIYVQWFQEVVHNTAKLVAGWQAVGYCHGVMNTDNMSILGITIDHGPFGFLDAYDPGWICNHSDTEGRYAFEQQPGIAAWNLVKLAHCLLHLMADGAPVTVNDAVDAPRDEGNVTIPDSATSNEAWAARIKSGATHAQRIMSTFERVFLDTYADRMREKLGLQQARPDDLNALIIPLLSLLYHRSADYTRFFRTLSDTPLAEVSEVLDHAWPAASATDKQQEAWQAWCGAYVDRVQEEHSTAADEGILRQAQMRAVNPKFILRNWMAQQCIERAEQGDNDSVRQLLRLVGTARAFEDGEPADQIFAGEVPAWGKGLQCSCSS